jgi:hypothetical protein
MQDNSAGKTLEAEFDCLMARAGLTVPPARKANYLAAFADLRSQLPLLHTNRDATVEPANVFRLVPTETTR